MANTEKQPEVLPAASDPQERRVKYNRAVREAQLVALFLSRVDFKVKRENMLDHNQPPRLSYSSGRKNFTFEKTRGACFISIQWHVEIKTGRKQIAKCSAVYDLIYDGFTTTDEEIIKLFAKNVAESTSYTYFRALYASLDWSAELRSPPLPIIKFQPRV
jgi:hypothetical protein